jgi:DNA-binding LytR/AlgR family response regulator
LIKQGERTTPVPPGAIVWVEAASQYARVHTRDTSYLLSRPLADVASELPDSDFMRVHRSALVNRSCIRHVRNHDGHCRLELSNGVEVPVARSRRKQVLAALRVPTASADA